MNFRDLSRNILARKKVLYEGHPIAAVAAVTLRIAREAAETDPGGIRDTAICAVA